MMPHGCGGTRPHTDGAHSGPQSEARAVTPSTAGTGAAATGPPSPGRPQLPKTSAPEDVPQLPRGPLQHLARGVQLLRRHRDVGAALARHGAHLVTEAHERRAQLVQLLAVGAVAAAPAGPVVHAV